MTPEEWAKFEEERSKTIKEFMDFDQQKAMQKYIIPISEGIDPPTTALEYIGIQFEKYDPTCSQ